MLILTLATLAALVIAVINGPAQPLPPIPYRLLIFTIGLFSGINGLDASPIEISAINSAWLKTKMVKAKLTPGQIMLDFKVGYFVTVALAVVFVGLAHNMVRISLSS